MKIFSIYLNNYILSILVFSILLFVVALPHRSAYFVTPPVLLDDVRLWRGTGEARLTKCAYGRREPDKVRLRRKTAFLGYILYLTGMFLISSSSNCVFAKRAYGSYFGEIQLRCRQASLKTFVLYSTLTKSAERLLREKVE